MGAFREAASGAAPLAASREVSRAHDEDWGTHKEDRPNHPLPKRPTLSAEALFLRTKRRVASGLPRLTQPRPIKGRG